MKEHTSPPWLSCRPVLRERLPKWSPIKNDESKIRAALQVLMPEYRPAARSRNNSARVGRWWSKGFEDVH